MRFYLTYINILFSLFLHCQNWTNVTTDYINNPSFEEYSGCPLNNSAYPLSMWIDSCTNWTAPTLGTSDYFNTCNTNGLNDIPNNTNAVYQPSFHGNAYCGFLAYDITFPPLWCEYIQTKLKKKLLPNEIYNFTMRINRANGYNFSVQNIGAHFCKDSLRNKTTTKPFNITPTVLNNTGFLNDTLNWTLITGVFLAKGDEEYLTIGWYGDTITSDYIYFIPPDTVPLTGELLYVPSIYYLVDSLTLSIETKKNVSNFNINIFTPNNDGVNDYIDFSNYNLTNINFDLYNRWGNLVFSSTDINLKWEGFDNKNIALNDGVYFYIIKAKIPNIRDIIEKKGYLTIIH